MIVAETIARLQGQAVPPFALVDGVAGLAALKDTRSKPVPAAYVYPKEEASHPNSRMNSLAQQVEADIGVLLITRNVGDPRGAAAADDLEALKAAVRAALLGWQPASAITAIEDVGGVLISAAGGEVRWEMTFSATFMLFGA